MKIPLDFLHEKIQVFVNDIEIIIMPILQYTAKPNNPKEHEFQTFPAFDQDQTSQEEQEEQEFLDDIDVEYIISFFMVV